MQAMNAPKSNPAATQSLNVLGRMTAVLAALVGYAPSMREELDGSLL